MIPRVAIPDSDDRRMILAGLAGLAHATVATLPVGPEMIEKINKITSLMSAIVDSERAAQEFGSVPTDADITAFFESRDSENDD